VTRRLRDPLLDALGVEHGFGTRDDAEPGDVVRARQVHGTAVHRVTAPGDAAGVEADAIVCDRPGIAVGVVTADCVPVLVVGAEGRAVAAIHAGWRGLCAGVVSAGVAALGAPPAAAAIGPHVGPCCYEVDAPVLAAVRARFGAEPPAGAVRAGRAGHAWLDLGALVAAELVRAGVPAGAIGRAAVACTACDSDRFHSYRRDGARSGRLVHFVRARGPAERSR
jgi:YfiH family protein